LLPWFKRPWKKKPEVIAHDHEAWELGLPVTAIPLVEPLGTRYGCSQKCRGE
jgi:hypothetical protein